jgi:hypothetical protein
MWIVGVETWGFNGLQKFQTFVHGQKKRSSGKRGDTECSNHRLGKQTGFPT